MSVFNTKPVSGYFSKLAFLLATSALLAACVPVNESLNPLQAYENTKVYIVRHAEKASNDRDPQLSEKGFERAQRLARLLSGEGVDKLWSSDYQRTKQTLAPLAKQQGLPVTVYDAGNSRALVSAIFEEGQGKTHVIAGHSNTVPELVDLFEVFPAQIGELEKRPNLDHNEYDRLYVIRWVKGRKAVIEPARF